MYESFEVQNFRGLSSLRLDDLARVNLITGQNNVGKTSVLEALYLHCGDYMGDLLLQLDAQRGLIRRRIDQEQLDEAPWNSLFPQFDSKQWITLNGRFANGEQRQTELLVLTNDVIQDFIQYIPDTSSRFHLLMRYQIAASDPKHFDSGEELLWLDSDDGYGAARANHKPAPFLSFFLAATVRPPPAQLADWFSVLTRRGPSAKGAASAVGRGGCHAAW